MKRKWLIGLGCLFLVAHLVWFWVILQHPEWSAPSEKPWIGPLVAIYLPGALWIGCFVGAFLFGKKKC